MMTRDKIQTVLDALAKPWKHEQVEAAIAILQAALAEPSEPVAWTESAIDEYLSGYSLIGDDGDYTPTDDEKFVIKDAIIGFMSATPDCWDTAAYPALEDAIIEAKAWEHCTNEDCAHPATSKPAPLPELTDEEIKDMWSEAHDDTSPQMPYEAFARAILAAAREKAK